MIMTQRAEQNIQQSFNTGSNIPLNNTFNTAYNTYLYNPVSRQMEQSQNMNELSNPKDDIFARYPHQPNPQTQNDSENIASSYNPYAFVYQRNSDNQNFIAKKSQTKDIERYRTDHSSSLPGLGSIVNSDSTNTTRCLSIPIIPRNDSIFDGTASISLGPTDSYDHGTTNQVPNTEQILQYQQYQNYVTNSNNNDAHDIQNTRLITNPYPHIPSYYYPSTIGSYQFPRLNRSDSDISTNIGNNFYAGYPYYPNPISNGFPSNTSMASPQSLEIPFNTDNSGMDQSTHHQMLLMSMMANGSRVLPLGMMEYQQGIQIDNNMIPKISDNSTRSTQKYACRACIRGHRAPSCRHTDRQLFPIRPRGRPSNQCPHCKEARKSNGLHVKCLCNGSRGSISQIFDNSSNKGTSNINNHMYEYYHSENNSMTSSQMNSRCLCNLGLPCICGASKRTNITESNNPDASIQ